MKSHTRSGLIMLAIFAIVHVQSFTTFAQGTAFTYQGSLNNSGAPANGSYDLAFALYATNVTGSAIAGPVTNSAVAVSNGLFTTTVDFGPNVFTGGSNWLQLSVSTNGANAFSALTPRQQLTPVPYAIFANTASNLSGSLPAAQLSGTVPLAQLPTALVTNNAANITLAGTFSGNGASVSNVNAAALNGLNATNFWQLGGNGVSPGQFLGSTNSQALEVRVAGSRAFRLEPTGSGTGVPNVIGGWSGNLDDNGAQGVTIAGGGAPGFVNHVSAPLGTVAGGSGNVIGTNANDATIGGGRQNIVDTNNWGAVIAGGHGNWIQPSYSSTAAGYSAVSGGYENVVQTNVAAAAIGGGWGNVIGMNGGLNFIGGGYFNTNMNYYGVIGGGQQNYNTSQGGTIAGGQQNISTGTYQSTVGGGVGNQATASYATVAGGFQNIAAESFTAVGGGQNNQIQPLADHSYIGGGLANIITSPAIQTVIGGGQYNTNGANQSLIGSGIGNAIFFNSYGSVLAGGQNNMIGSNSIMSVLGGGQGNTIQTLADHSAIGGGGWNTIVGSLQFPVYGVIGGGYSNLIQTNSMYSAVGGGYGNIVSNSYATVPGGSNNMATGNFSLAAGQQAQALHQGAFVWADSQNAPFASAANDSFNVRAQGGVRFVTGGAGVAVDGQTVLSGTVKAGQLSGGYTNAVALTNAGNVFSGNGGGLTNLNASQLTSGTIPVAQLPPAVVTNGESGLSLNVSNLSITAGSQIAPLSVPPNVPTAAAGTLSGIGQIQGLAVSGRYAYVAGSGSNTLLVIDVSTPANPTTVGSLTGLNAPSSIAVAGRYAYLVGYNGNTLQIVDVSTPSSPVSVSTLTGFNEPASIAVAGRYAYVVNQGSGILQIIDVSNPSNPVSVGTLTGLSAPGYVAVSGRYAYVGGSSGGSFQIVDVSNPTSPASMGSVPLGFSIGSIAVSGRYAYVVNEGGNKLQIVDVSNPSSPAWLGTLTGLSAPADIAVSGRYAYVADYGGSLQIVDVSNPSSPVSVGTVGAGQNPTALAVSGRYAYVINEYGNSLQVYDLGGAYIQGLEAGTIEAGTLQTRDTATVGNNLNVRGGLTVSASARITGGLGADSITATNFNGSFIGNGGGMTNLNLSGTYGGAVTLNNSGNSFAGSFTGNGGSVTNVNALALNGLNATNFWKTGGNSGTTPGANYLGTSDNQALEMHVDGVRVLRLEPTVSGTGVPNVIGGWSGNLEDNSSQGVAIGGGGASGYVNHVSASLGTIAGGSGNYINTNANDSTIGGGRQNTIDLNSWGGVIGGGHGNYIQGGNAGGGGLGNTSYSVIGGGYGNVVGVNVNNATIGGGGANTNSGNYATIPGGYENLASAAYAFAAGQNAQATNTGAFVWSDDSASSVFVSTNNNSFNARAAGGFQFYTSSSGRGGAGLYVAPGGNSWVTISDRNAKKDFAPVNYQAVLDKLAQVPVEQWHYLWESDKDTLNIGPMAQDFIHAFYPGRDDKGISTLEFDGVELAAIQGLNQKLSEKDSEIQTLKQQNDQLAQRLNELEAAVKLLAERK